MNRKKIERLKSESHVFSEARSQNVYTKDSEYGVLDDLANLMSEINLKQKLTKELELSQRRLSNLEQHYENKLQQLQTTIKLTQEERNTVLSYLRSNNNLTGIMKKVQDDYEQKLNSIQKELKSLHSAKEEHAKHLINKSQYENQIQALNYEVNNKKYTEVEPIDFRTDKTEEKTTEYKVDVKKANLKKDSKKAEIRMLNLESKSRSLSNIFKKQEEVTAYVAKSVNNIQKNSVRNHQQKNSYQTWINLERDITALTLNERTLYLFKKHLERLLQEQKKLHSDLNYQQAKLAEVQIQSGNSNFHHHLENEIEAIKDNLNCVDENIKELEENILQVEDSKTISESLKLDDRVHNLPDAIYILEKLIQMTLDSLCLATQKDIDLKELETKMHQLEKENEIQRQLIEYILSNRESANEKPAGGESTSNDKKRRSILSSTSSSGSSSRLDIKISAHSKNDFGKNNQKQKTVPAQKVLNNSKNVDKQFLGVSRLRLPRLNSFLRKDKSKQSPRMAQKKIVRQLSMSPILIKEDTFIISSNTHLPSKLGSKLNQINVPKSTPPRRRLYYHNENDLNRQTSITTQSIEQQRSKGVIRPCQEKTTFKTSLVCSHIAEGHSKAVLALHATDDMLFSASKDKTVKIWDLNNGKEIQTLDGHPNNVVAIKYDEDTQLVFSVSSSYVRVWDMRLHKSIKTLSSSGIVNNGSVMSSQIPVGEIKLSDIALNNYGRTLYMATGDKVKIWDLRNFTVRGKLSCGPTTDVQCLTIGQFDSKNIVVTGSKDHTIKMFEVGKEVAGTYNPIVTLEPPHYNSIQALVLRDQMLFSGSRDYALKKWDLDKQELVTSINNAHSDWISGLAVVPNQPLLLSVCRYGYLKMWSQSSCSLLGEIKAHDSPVNAIATNSTHVFTAARDGTVKLWQVKI